MCAGVAGAVEGTVEGGMSIDESLVGTGLAMMKSLFFNFEFLVFRHGNA